MRFKLLLNGLLIVVVINSCIAQNDKYETDSFNQNKVISADSIWTNFLEKLQEKDVVFLVKNSLDSIQCADCNLTERSESDWYDPAFVYSNHISKLLHMDNISKIGYTTYADGEIIHVNYSIESEEAMEGGYNLIFTFIKVKDKFLFKGMIVT